jgi:hypothetical protein
MPKSWSESAPAGRIHQIGHVRQSGITALARHRQRLDAPGLDERQRSGQRRNRVLHFAGNHGRIGLVARLERHVHRLDADGRVELLDRQVNAVAHPARSEVERAGLGLGQCDEILQRVHAELGRHRQDLARCLDQAKVGEGVSSFSVQ